MKTSEKGKHCMFLKMRDLDMMLLHRRPYQPVFHVVTCQCWQCNELCQPQWEKELVCKANQKIACQLSLCHCLWVPYWKYYTWDFTLEKCYYHGVRQVSFPGMCQAGSVEQNAARKAVYYVKQDMSRRGHQYRRPDSKGIQCYQGNVLWISR